MNRLRRWQLIGVLGLVVGCVRSAPQAAASHFSDADAYERFMGRWSRRLAGPMVEQVKATPGGRVLDVGSGTGALAFAFAQADPHASVVGVDLSPEYVDFARANNRFGERVRFEVGDALQLPFEAGSFDAVASLLVVNHVPDPGRALDEMVRVARPGAVIAAVVWDYGQGMQLLRVFWDEAVALDPAADAKDQRHMPLVAQGQLAELWRSHGLSEVTESTVKAPLQFASFDDFWAPFSLGQGPAGAYVGHLTAEQRGALEQRLRKRLLGDGPDRPFELEGRAWLVLGKAPGRH